MRVDTEESKIWVRQSWLNDAMICPERSRLSVTMPDWRKGSDATHIGTAVHRGIENYLTTGTDTTAHQAAVDELERLIHEEPFSFNSTKDTYEMHSYIPKLLDTFFTEIAPHVVLGGRVEQNFGVKLFDLVDKEVWLGGTIDYVDPNGVIWDWKTAGRKYSQGEKQRQSIQATAYAYACVENGWAANYPVRFNYSVMTRATKSVGQIVPVMRTKAHIDWFRHQVHSVVAPFMRVGFDQQWMANDQHGLCSEKWCPYWSICKGSRISDFDNNNTNMTGDNQ